MNIAGKVWGTTQVLIKTPFFEVHRIEIEPSAWCSLHKHEHKYNAFYVEQGSLDVEVHKNDYELIDTTHLEKGQLAIVKPGEFHKFKSRQEKVIAFEIYWIGEISEDIIRKTVGGILRT